MNFTSLAAFAEHIATQVRVRAAEEAVIERACQMVETRAKEAIGTYQFGWPELADRTQQDRVSRGFSPNVPGLRTGAM